MELRAQLRRATVLAAAAASILLLRLPPLSSTMSLRTELTPALSSDESHPFSDDAPPPMLSPARKLSGVGFMDGGASIVGGMGGDDFSRVPAPQPPVHAGSHGLPPPPPMLPAQSQTTQSHNKRRKTLILLIILTVTGVVVGSTIMLITWSRRKQRRGHNSGVVDGIPGDNVFFQGEEEEDQVEEDEDNNMARCKAYSYKVLEAATCHFSNSNKLGSGGFGTVYRGTLENGKEVAVKRIKDSKRSQQELEWEVSIVAKLRHRNLVKFLGYCFEEEASLLVYEYLPNSSLDKFWNKGINLECRKLDWPTWLNIIKGVARGIWFLHNNRIIHRDLKPHNILLDENFNPKIADFDLVRVFDKDRTHESTEKVAGTFGYMAPECTNGRRFQISVKSDVYSFGVLVLEILTGRKIHTFEGGNYEGLVEYVWQQWTKGKTYDVLDGDLDVEATEQWQALRCVHIALLCVQADRSRRPSMGEVISMISTDQNQMELPQPSLPGYLHLRSSSGRSLRPLLPCFGCT